MLAEAATEISTDWNTLNSFFFLMVILFLLYIFKKGDDE